MGTTPFGCQASPFAFAINGLPWSDPSLTLPCGASYHLTVRATNCAGLQHSVASSAVKLCCEGPTGGAVALLSTDGAAVRYVTSSTNVTLHWSGFTEPCSGVREYSVVLTKLGDATALWTHTQSAEVTPPVQVPTTVIGSLSHGLTYAVSVTATSFAGLSGTSFAELTIDDSPPANVTGAFDWPGRTGAGVGWRTERRVSSLAPERSRRGPWRRRRAADA